MLCGKHNVLGPRQVAQNSNAPLGVAPTTHHVCKRVQFHSCTANHRPLQVCYAAVQAVPEARERTSFPFSSSTVPTSITKHNADPALQGQVVYSMFRWPSVLGGQEIAIWGSFNDWTRGYKLHRVNPSADATVILSLTPGNYEFKYVVDKVWTPGPHEPTITNSEGHLNNHRVVAASVQFTYHASSAQNVMVVGDWDDWHYTILLQRDVRTGTFSTNVHLPAGQYSYLYIVDGQVMTNPAQQVHMDAERGEVHRVWSYEPALFRVFYCTGWDDTVLQYRRVVDGQPLTKDWQSLMMVNAPSRGNALGVWKAATLVPTHEAEVLEFVLTNGLSGAALKEDRPGGSSSGGGGQSCYVCPFPGSFKLVRGMLRPFPRGAEARMMLVSDIDGTMIGDVSSADAFISSHRFADYWENSASLAGSLLVYNTGRSLGQFVDLMRKCDGKVAIPDVVITAVGTKVWHLDETIGRASASGLKWIEDTHWAASLDAGWRLDVVRRIARSLVNTVGDMGLLTILDDGTEHQHRFALCADVKVMDHVTHTLATEFKRERLEIRIIVSGNGSHRYIDCVPVTAGKEKALQYVRQQFGIPEHLCVAAGDSGNDVLMLEGDHPSIVVGNAQPELLSWLVRQPQSGKVVYTDASYADGILEGLARHALY